MYFFGICFKGASDTKNSVIICKQNSLGNNHKGIKCVKRQLPHHHYPNGHVGLQTQTIKRHHNSHHQKNSEAIMKCGQPSCCKVLNGYTFADLEKMRVDEMAQFDQGRRCTSMLKIKQSEIIMQ